MVSFLILNGPNINMLGRRDTSLYGSKTLEEVNQEIKWVANELGVEVIFYQSNLEGELVNCIQEHWGKIQGIVLNAGALTHYGLSLKDALIDSRLPVVEVHLSNPLAREDWRRVSVISDIARGQIAGFGWRSYTSALKVLSEVVEEESR
ncbi:MAG: type II 3-dehydroquinate dehydratase [SAR202 cluster bacterium]|nr:type II 3-dehydroquinate dehydratase [Chloroflexota bacterium]MAQ54689.1 type II 3-dehydroquinate dehydratase [Chloroflexota bacterium]MBC51530.1 type II 3-dehydroquinate dehydratase [Chloroflexota bacterium]MQG50134.1 type II 3-dehydroquinate dehydratase [SAR202 cluster bacterium]MQG79270.1 type II 3-dehydroquinate dehydratase [SAR202 cluster bacterium]|tara:strand:- start:7729 stop:8175 length:447 start_codon:yes stop_codon:yes gene_type:complete